MKDYGSEEVYCIDRQDLEEIVELVDTGFTCDPFPREHVKAFLGDIWTAGEYVLRNEAETNDLIKQIIPYCIIIYGDVMLHYSRAKTAGEARLGGKRSIGVGGHINPSLRSDNYYHSLYRELEEEIGIKRDDIESVAFLGMVNDEENEVGRVHYGIVHVVRLKAPDLGEIEHHLIDVKWSTPREIILEANLETWSDMILTGLMPDLDRDSMYLESYYDP